MLIELTKISYASYLGKQHEWYIRKNYNERKPEYIYLTPTLFLIHLRLQPDCGM